MCSLNKTKLSTFEMKQCTVLDKTVQFFSVKLTENVKAGSFSKGQKVGTKILKSQDLVTVSDCVSFVFIQDFPGLFLNKGSLVDRIKKAVLTICEVEMEI